MFRLIPRDISIRVTIPSRLIYVLTTEAKGDKIGTVTWCGKVTEKDHDHQALRRGAGRGSAENVDARRWARNKMRIVDRARSVYCEKISIGLLVGEYEDSQRRVRVFGPAGHALSGLQGAVPSVAFRTYFVARGAHNSLHFRRFCPNTLLYPGECLPFAHAKSDTHLFEDPLS